MFEQCMLIYDLVNVRNRNPELTVLVHSPYRQRSL